MDKISCDVCLDLLPLVKDGVASEDSESLVLEHIQGCPGCGAIYTGEKEVDGTMNDALITKKIKRRLLFCVVTVILFGVSAGMMIVDGMNMFYNALIMPAIGGFGYLFLRKKAFYAPLAVFLFSVVWNLLSNLAGGFSSGWEQMVALLLAALFMSGIYTFFSIIGLVIAWSLCYAFEKGDT